MNITKKFITTNSMILATVILMDFLAGMEFDLFVPSFPALESYFNLSPFLVEALLSVNFVGYCLSLLFVGVLADHYGRKPIILAGITVFIIGSILCLWSNAYQYLLLGRFFQGIGIAAPAILSFLIVADAYPLKKQQFFMAMLNAIMNTSVAVAPVIGSYITLYFNWQGNFMILLLLGFIVLIMAICFIPTYKLPQHKETLSFRGYTSLFKSKPLMLLMINIIFMLVPYWIFVGMSPLLYMKSLGVTLVYFGYYQGALALIFALGSVLFGLIMHKYKNKKMLSIAYQIYILSLISIILVTILDSHNALLITFAFIPFIISQIIPSTILYPICLNFIPQAKSKVAAILQGSRLIFSAACLQFTGYFYQGSFRNIGIIIATFIFMIIITHIFVMKNQELMKSIQE